jgi:predicted RNase H-like nuclease
MVLFRDPNGRRMVTTSVRRILGGSDDGVLYVETENSVYRIIMNEALAAARSRSSAG